MLNDYILYIFIGIGSIGLLIILTILFYIYSYFKNKNTNANTNEVIKQPKENSDFENGIIKNQKLEKNQEWFLSNTNLKFIVIDFDNDTKKLTLKASNDDTFSLSYILFEQNYLFIKKEINNQNNNKLNNEKVA
tara:strand:+ start:1644 stop:2045 length:402 start_codon:yes stop_codon:yes gene_type:complete